MKFVAVIGISLVLLLSAIAFAKVDGGDVVFEVKKGMVTISHASHDKLSFTKAMDKKAAMAYRGKA